MSSHEANSPDVSGKSLRTFNVFGTFRLGELDFERMASEMSGAVYYPEFSPSIDKYIDGCLFKIYSTGNVACFGPTQGQVSHAAARLAALLNRLGFNVLTPDLIFHSQGFVIDVGKKLRLTKALYLLKGAEMSQKGPPFIKYFPEKSGITFQLFESGKIVCLGSKSIAESYESLSVIMNLIRELNLTI